MQAIIIDDNELKIKLIQKCILLYLSSLDVADCGTSALNLLEKNKYQYIFIDHHLPDCKGSDLLEHIKKHHYSSKLISISNDSNILKNYHEIGYDDVLTYPIHKSVERIFSNT